MSNGIKLSKPCLGSEEAQTVLEVMNSGQLAHGLKNREFEELFADAIGVKHAISMNSCASALQIALEANNIKGSVIIPSFTFSATGNAVIKAGASIQYTEINPVDCMIEPNLLEVQNNTEALIVVHFGGLCADMNPIIAFCEKNHLLLIEDSAECIGGTYYDKVAGSFGIGCFSFFPTKNITSGEGGMFTTNDNQLAEKVRKIISHGVETNRPHPWHREATEIGVNYRMSNIHAAIGLEQLKKLDVMNEKRREIARQYIEMLRHFNVQVLGDLPGRKNVHQMFNIILPDHNRDEVVQKMNALGIETSVHFSPPLHKQSAFKRYIQLNQTEYVSDHIISLPMHPQLSSEDVTNVVASLFKCMFLK